MPFSFEKNMISTIRIASLILVLLMACPLRTPAGIRVVRVAVDDSYPPYMFGADPARGLYPDIIRAAFGKVSITVRIVGYPWKRALRLGKEGQAAIGGIYRNHRRLQIFDYSDPIFTETLVVCVRKGHRFPFRGMADLAGKRVGINRGWSYGEKFDSARRAGRFDAEEATDNVANLRKLLSGRLDCMIADRLSLQRILHRRAWSREVEMLDFPATVNNAYLAVLKDARQRHLLQQFNRGLADIKADGTYQQIVDRYVQGTGAD